MNLIFLSSFELCCTQIYNTCTHRYIHTHTHTQTFSRKRIFHFKELGNVENHRNLSQVVPVSYFELARASVHARENGFAETRVISGKTKCFKGSP